MVVVENGQVRGSAERSLDNFLRDIELVLTRPQWKDILSHEGDGRELDIS